MNYYIKEIYQEEERQTAASKAREDVETILQELGAQPLPLSVCAQGRQNYPIWKKIYVHLAMAKAWKRKLSPLQKGDVLFAQAPFEGHTVFQAGYFRKALSRGVHIVLLIHDLEMLRFSKSLKTGHKAKLRIWVEERPLLLMASKVIVHNRRMLEMVHKLGVPREKIVSLEIFDYLISNYDSGRMERRAISKDLPVIIAGNLKRQKAAYVYSLPDNCRFNLYGIRYEGRQTGGITYYGAFPPEEIPYVLSGSFGLVWDGNSAETCSGAYGEYLKINNPHKTSLYLAAGLPVIVWEQAAMAEFVVKRGCGITIRSLSDIAGKVSSMSEEEYALMRGNAAEVGAELRGGTFTKKAAAQCGGAGL